MTLDRSPEAFRTGHRFMCATGGQRDMCLLAERLIRSAVYERDPTMLHTIAEVPFGVSDGPPTTRDRLARGNDFGFRRRR